MQETLLRTLRAHRAAIRDRWEALLRIEKVNTPLANPDTLVYLFDKTLDDIFAELRHPHPIDESKPETCGCGKNPLVNYFVAGEQAILEALILAQAEMVQLDPTQRDADFAQLKSVVHAIAQRDLGQLDAVCQQQQIPSAGSDI